VHGASATAREKVEAAGGTLTLLKEPKVKKAKKHRTAPVSAPEDEDNVTEETAIEAEPEASADEPESEE
jgi:hypothetical protein